MIITKKDGKLYLFPNYQLGYVCNELKHEVVKHLALPANVRVMPVAKGRTLEDHISEQSRLLLELKSEYKRKLKNKVSLINELEALRCYQ